MIRLSLRDLLVTGRLGPVGLGAARGVVADALGGTRDPARAPSSRRARRAAVRGAAPVKRRG